MKKKTTKPPKTLTKAEVNELRQLQTIAKSLQDALDWHFKRALSITAEKTESGYTFDYIYNDFHSVEDLLEKLKIDVIELE